MMSEISAASLLALAWKSKFWFVPEAASLLAQSFVFASDCHTWALGAASFWFESSAASLHTQSRCFENPWRLDALELGAVEELAAARELRFSVGFDFATILSSPFFFLHHFRYRFRAAVRAKIANVEQMEKVVPLITCEIALRQYVCELVLVSTYLIWIFGSNLILSNNQSSATLWDRDTRLIVGLLPLLIILITASLSSKMYNWDSLLGCFVRQLAISLHTFLCITFHIIGPCWDVCIKSSWTR